MLSQTADAHVCQKLKGVSAKGVLKSPLEIDTLKLVSWALGLVPEAMYL